MKKLMVVLMLFSAGLVHANINVTEGSGKTVATTSDASLEFQNIVVSTSYVNNVSGVPKALGYATGNSSMPVNVINIPAVSQSGTWTAQPGNTPNTAGWMIDFSTGIKANQGTAGVGWKVDFSTGVQAVQGAAGTSGWKVDYSTGLQVNTKGGANLGIDLSTGARVNTTGGPNLGIDLSTGAQVIGSLADNGAASATNRLAVVPSIYQTSYLNGTAATQGRNGALSQGTDGLLWTAALPALRPASFSASTGTITTAASATDITALCGNASNTVLVYGMRASCTETTAGNVSISIQKRSTVEVGLYSTMTAVAQDSNYAAAISSAIWFGANPTVGTLVGNVDNYKLGCMATGTATPNDIYISPSDWKMKPIVLRGTTQCLVLNLAGVSVTGGQFTVTYDWMETATITP